MSDRANAIKQAGVVCELLRLGLFAVVGASAGWTLATTYVDQQERHETVAWLQQADDLIPREIDNLQRSSESLALLVQQANGRFGPQELALYGPQILKDQTPNSALNLAPQGVIQGFYPTPSSTKWRGVNILRHPLYQQSSAHALRHRQSVLQGPVPLLRGGIGLIVRTPVFLGPSQQFWGFVNALGPWSSWLSQLKTQALSHQPPMRFGLQVRDSQGSIYRSPGFQQVQASGVSGIAQTVPGGSVTLVAMPTGWTASQTALMLLAPLTGASIGAGIALSMCQHQRRRQVAQLEMELSKAKALDRYQALFEESVDAVSVINRDLRFIEANARVVVMYGAESVEAFLTLQPLDFSPEHQLDGRLSAEVALERINEAFETGSVEFEYLHKRLDTGEPWLGQVSLRRIELNDQPVLMARVRDITERRRYEQRIEDLAYRDGLTGLPNRIASQEWLDRQLQQSSEQRWLLINLDIDDFRSLNEAFGQEIGDRLLCWVADALTTALPPAAWLARLDSDEFLVVLPLDGSSDGALKDAQRWVSRLQQQASDAAGEQRPNVPRVSLSAGCAIAEPGTASGALALMQQANTGLQQAKDVGRGAMELYSAAVSAVIQERLAIEQELELALAPEQQDHAFRLLYQPQVNRSGRAVRAEALLRFTGSQGQLIPPDVFIPLAERSGQIHRIGRWVMETAIHQQAIWRDEGCALMPLSINISARQLDDLPGHPPLLEQVQELLSRFQVEPQHIFLELTETALLLDSPRIRQQLRELVASGIKISLDDFGAGYSSLAVLRDYPVSQVKIDKGFTRHVGLDPRSCAIVEALVAITRARRMDLVAEGVETSEQREALIHLGLRLFQGYLYAPALTPVAFAEVLQDPDRLSRPGSQQGLAA